MNKYFNPRLLNTVVAGTGMKHPRKPHVIIGDKLNGFVQGDLMDANAIEEFIDQKIEQNDDLDLEKIEEAVNKVVGLAPEALNTLQELSAALDNDANFATTMTDALAKKVDKVTGKGLSTNDYTDEDQQKLNTVTSGLSAEIDARISADNALSDSIASVQDAVEAEVNARTSADASIKQDIDSIKENLYGRKIHLLDYLFADGTVGSTIEDKIPVAICVAPASHFEDGKARFMSLKYMANDSGDNTVEYTGLPFYDYEDGANNGGTSHHYRDIVTLSGSLKCVYNVNLPFGRNSEDRPDLTTIVKVDGWYYDGTNENYAPSPFLQDGNLNSTVRTDGQILADVFGKRNTTEMLAANGYTEYVAVACSNYSPGIYDKEWYLPAAGELAYAAVNQRDINNAISYANENFPGCGAELDITRERLYTSTIDDWESPYILLFDMSYFVDDVAPEVGSSSNFAARAFISIDPNDIPSTSINTSLEDVIKKLEDNEPSEGAQVTYRTKVLHLNNGELTLDMIDDTTGHTKYILKEDVIETTPSTIDFYNNLLEFDGGAIMANTSTLKNLGNYELHYKNFAFGVPFLTSCMYSANVHRIICDSSTTFTQDDLISVGVSCVLEDRSNLYIDGCGKSLPFTIKGTVDKDLTVAQLKNLRDPSGQNRWAVDYKDFYAMVGLTIDRLGDILSIGTGSFTSTDPVAFPKMQHVEIKNLNDVYLTGSFGGITMDNCSGITFNSAGGYVVHGLFTRCAYTSGKGNFRMIDCVYDKCDNVLLSTANANTLIKNSIVHMNSPVTGIGTKYINCTLYIGIQNIYKQFNAESCNIIPETQIIIDNSGPAASYKLRLINNTINGQVSFYPMPAEIRGNKSSDMFFIIYGGPLNAYNPSIDETAKIYILNNICKGINFNNFLSVLDADWYIENNTLLFISASGKNVIIKNNTVTDSTGQGVTITYTENCNMSNNVFADLISDLTIANANVIAQNNFFNFKENAHIDIMDNSKVNFYNNVFNTDSTSTDNHLFLVKGGNLLLWIGPNAYGGGWASPDVPLISDSDKQYLTDIYKIRQINEEEESNG